MDEHCSVFTTHCSSLHVADYYSLLLTGYWFLDTGKLVAVYGVQCSLLAMV